uniref:NADH dehydrogenase subunit 2 n=1 Tax=Virpazaria ripkeni TaxID=2939667 RepID=UPI002028FE44|nr:NADH dehydrogenase subunit 2 [Virpazaria ripkeni]UPV69732.1 NADH dehydrogenase subunit 2 [Virpazaria ripkeni]UPV69745.1 NADH dehydrogenase subunit 2 [Virpazaria ripkeni]
MITFSSMVLMGPLISLSSTNWLLLWGGMEISLMGLLPIMNMNKNIMALESSMKYFLFQAYASIMVLIGGISFVLTLHTNYLHLFLIITGLLIKMGMFPLHFWVIPVVMGSKYSHMMYLLGPMKVVPLMLLTHITKIDLLNNFYFFVSILSMFMGSLLGNNSTNTRAMLGASSINHSGWMLLSCQIGMGWNYFFTYMISLIMLLLMIISHSSSLSSLLLLNLSGLPPFLLFAIKFNVLYYVVINLSYILIIFIIILSALMGLNFYLKFSYLFMLMGDEKHHYLLVSLSILLLTGGIIMLTL